MKAHPVLVTLRWGMMRNGKPDWKGSLRIKRKGIAFGQWAATRALVWSANGEPISDKTGYRVVHVPTGFAAFTEPILTRIQALTLAELLGSRMPRFRSYQQGITLRDQCRKIVRAAIKEL